MQHRSSYGPDELETVKREINRGLVALIRARDSSVTAAKLHAPSTEVEVEITALRAEIEKQRREDHAKLFRPVGRFGKGDRAGIEGMEYRVTYCTEQTTYTDGCWTNVRRMRVTKKGWYR